MKIETVDTFESASFLSEEKDKTLFMLRPNGTDSITLKPSNNFSSNFQNQILTTFVDDNFPHFKLFPVDQRVAFGNYLLSANIPVSESHVFINCNLIDIDNECLKLHLQSRYPSKLLIPFKDAESPLSSLGGLSVKALFDIGIIEICSSKLTYPIKIATTNKKPYESYGSLNQWNTLDNTELKCA